MKTLHFAAALAALAAIAPAQNCLSTLFASNNGGGVGGAVYFDATFNVPMTITSLETNYSAALGVPVGVDVYMTAAGTSYAGNEANAAAWTLMASDDGSATSAGTDAPTSITLQNPLGVSSGTYGIALVARGSAHRYTNGTGSNQNFSDANLALALGSATNAPFSGAAFTPRIWNGTLCYILGSNVARAIPYGEGCGADTPPSIWEQWTVAGTFDLSNTAYLYSFTGAAYAIAPTAASTVAPSGTPLTIGDDQVIQVALPFALPRPGGSINDLWIDSNGRIGFEAITTDLSETVAELLSNPSTLAVIWDDLNPGPSGGGTVHAEVDPTDPTVFHVTFTGVPEFPAVGANDFQVTFSSSGSFTVKYGACSVADCIAGYSPGNGSTGSAIDFTNDLPLTLGSGRQALRLANIDRPVIGATSLSETRNIAAGAVAGVLVIGFSAVTPPFDFAPIGAPGCFWNAAADVTVGFPVAGSTASHPLSIPNDPSLAGGSLFLQSVVVDPIYNAAGLGTTNGLEYVLDVQ